jgi:fungal STAND N-terminal Goodbye domain
MLTSSTYTIHSIIDAALADYTKLTGTDLSKTPFATALEQSNSLEAVIQLLHEREKAFKEYRDDDRKLMNCLSPAVKVLQAFSDIVGEAVSQVSHTCHPATFLKI